MTRNSAEYQKFKADYEKDQQFRKDNPDKFPYFAYFQFGFHNMTYCSEDELQEYIKFYKLKKIGDKWERFGRQPITIMPRG